jgi:putative aminopeptidase FrvX
MKDIATLLRLFADAHGLSGYEDEVAALLKQELEPLVDEVTIDKMGNVVGVRAGEGPTVMVAAHMDEIGCMVSHIDDEGFLRVVPVGGWSDQTILGQRVLIATTDGRRIPGVIGSRPPHLMDAEERKKIVKFKDMFVDCGATSAAAAADMGVEIGCTATIDRQLLPLGPDLVTGKALDNRAGCAMMVTALKSLEGKPVRATIQAVGTVQEEVGLKGARTSAYGLAPDVAIATDVTIPGDHPGVTKSESHVCVGKGPAHHH